MEISNLYEKKCLNCGRLIYPTGDWVYKIKRSKQKTQWYCSYACWRKAGGGNAENGIFRKRYL